MKKPTRLAPETFQTMDERILILGIGSPHGDDRAGWAAIDLLSELLPKPTSLRKAIVPHEILDWLEPDVQTHVIDAACSGEPSVGRYEFFCNGTDLQSTHVSMPALRSQTTHQLDLMSTLQLAAVLQRLPRQFVLWTIPVLSVNRNAELQSVTCSLVEDCVLRIRSELYCA